MLSFIGRGNAFNYKEGNCSAFYKDNNRLLVIDCGEMTFHGILKYNLLDGIDTLDILITHLHSDHVGSIGTLLFYADMLNIKNINVAFPNLDSLKTILNIFGVKNCRFDILIPEKLDNYNIKPIRQNHDIMEAYGYILDINNNIVYYSGDTRTIQPTILEMLKNQKIDYFYQDTAKSKNPYHFSLEELDELIPNNVRNRVYCMHIAIDQDEKEIEKKGFTLVKKYEGK